LQFILLRWFARLFIWYRFLWNVSRIKLHLIPTHPDRAGGLGFLGTTAYFLSPILFAEGAIMAGATASCVLYRGEHLFSFKLQAFGYVALFVSVILGLLVMFPPQLIRARLRGLANYGLLAQRFVDGFERKWVVDEPSEELLGTSDIQSLADLANSHKVIRGMRPAPFGLRDISALAFATAVPMVPLLLTAWSLEELVIRIIKFVC